MSLNRENIIWPSKDGTWNRAFYDFTPEDWKDDYDYEWDVDYDFSRFNWVCTGLPTQEAAEEAWDGANPGGYEIIEKYHGNAKECRRLDKMAATFKKEARKERSARPYQSVSRLSPVYNYRSRW